ncbi:maleylpyruvate isomerase N-terminal domain-containing protein [Nocardioides aequoreus]|uniref:maleylpyruvate isomerase N-terminal domain-containing protein n=1 Tax=Nocardioides aequoreus TaxID=397278 RepID=UPI0004C37211|nr:maleylpyruvate isomerase N-terminal domain-containing protein [Nocardioides aequoreus]
MTAGEGDPVHEWARARARVSVLVREADATALARRVPACPGWTVLDLLRHMVGLGADVLAGNEPDDHDASWTQAQVDQRRDHDADALLAEWDLLAPDLERWMQAHGSRPLNDVVIHEQDLRGALGVPGARESAGFALVRDRMAGRLATAVAELPPVALVAPDWSWCSDGSVAQAPTLLRAPGYDLGRALTSRRTREQLVSYVERGDVAAYLPAFAGLGDLPERPLPE